MDVDYIRQKFRQLLRKRIAGAWIINYMERRRNSPDFSPNIVVVRRKQLNIHSISGQHRQLFLDDTVLTSWCSIEIVYY